MKYLILPLTACFIIVAQGAISILPASPGYAVEQDTTNAKRLDPPKSQIHENFFGLGLCRRSCRLWSELAGEIKTVALPDGSKANMASFIRNATKGPGTGEMWSVKKRANIYVICETSKMGVAETGKTPAIWASYNVKQPGDAQVYFETLCKK
jgi:hypothetical protein